MPAPVSTPAQNTETILTSDCSQSCTCQGPSSLQCCLFACPFGHTCSLRDSTHTCIARPGQCALSPATHFVTFDSITGSTLATSICVVASICDPRDSLWFWLLGDVRDIGDQPAVLALRLFTASRLYHRAEEGRRKVWFHVREAPTWVVPCPIPTMPHSSHHFSTNSLFSTPIHPTTLHPCISPNHLFSLNSVFSSSTAYPPASRVARTVDHHGDAHDPPGQLNPGNSGGTVHCGGDSGGAWRSAGSVASAATVMVPPAVPDQTVMSDAWALAEAWRAPDITQVVMWKIDISPEWPRLVTDVILKQPQIRKTRIFISPKIVLSPQNKT
ncbi:hypothetical protein DV515_00015513 [Chloebia gouldiae]|uniref:TILa domain-containing protein n=1 Tax=Chloebia gouldiae TaxID=44316 RepID=A0A3L8RWL8_CHLGU|nr:hypothetical protein DV515_00015513 [Chloebia gouldiae]